MFENTTQPGKHNQIFTNPNNLLSVKREILRNYHAFAACLIPLHKMGPMPQSNTQKTHN